MKTITLALIAAAICAAPVSAQTASKAASTKYYVDIDGHMAPVSGSSLEATLTFSHDVQVPGATLKAGSYLFTLISPTTMRITNEDRSKVYTTFATMPASRAVTTSHPQVRFERMPDGTTRLIGLYPDDASSGYAPIYRKTHKAPGAPIATSGTKP
jgi:hypothetical protein